MFTLWNHCTVCLGEDFVVKFGTGVPKIGKNRFLSVFEVVQEGVWPWESCWGSGVFEFGPREFLVKEISKFFSFWQSIRLLFTSWCGPLRRLVKISLLAKQKRPERRVWDIKTLNIDNKASEIVALRSIGGAYPLTLLFFHFCSQTEFLACCLGSHLGRLFSLVLACSPRFYWRTSGTSSPVGSGS